MNIDLQIQTKPEKNIKEDIKINKSSDVINIKEVQSIRNAVKEHLLFIGLDRGNNVRNISVLGIGPNSQVVIDSKDIIRTALLSCSDRVILVHNHPSNRLEPSAPDIHLTNVTEKILEAFNIELLDHIIVTEKEQINIKEVKRIANAYGYEKIENMSKGLLLEENQRLKRELAELKSKTNDKTTYKEDFEIEK